MKTQCIIFTALFLLLAAPAHAAVHRAPARVTHPALATTTSSSTSASATTSATTTASTTATTAATATATSTATTTAVGVTSPPSSGAVAPGNIYSLSHAYSPQMTTLLLGGAAVLALLGLFLIQAHAIAPHLRRVWG